MREPARAGETSVDDAQALTGEDRHLRKSLGHWQLTEVGFSGVIGSGWLLGAMYAAQAARDGASRSRGRQARPASRPR